MFIRSKIKEYSDYFIFIWQIELQRQKEIKMSYKIA